MAGEPFASGELALFLDAEGHQHLARLVESESLHGHLGRVNHADVIGQPEGCVVRTRQGKPYVVVRPRLLDYVFAMPRRSGIIYPKDAAHVLLWADIGPGMRVLEAGVGSGALTVALLRAVGESGQVIGYDQRADFLDLALANAQGFHGSAGASLLLREHDVYTGIPDGNLDRVVLDLPEPWRVVEHLPAALRWGGWVCAYSPSVLQAAQMVEALLSAGRYVQVEMHEVLLRGWHVAGPAVRPRHQMVGHTGFLTVGRLAAAGAAPSGGEETRAV